VCMSVSEFGRAEMLQLALIGMAGAYFVKFGNRLPRTFGVDMDGRMYGIQFSPHSGEGFMELDDKGLVRTTIVSGKQRYRTGCDYVAGIAERDLEEMVRVIRSQEDGKFSMICMETELRLHRIFEKIEEKCGEEYECIVVEPEMFALFSSKKHDRIADHVITYGVAGGEEGRPLIQENTKRFLLLRDHRVQLTYTQNEATIEKIYSG